MSLTKKLITLFLGISLAPLLVVSIVAYTNLRNEITRRTNADLAFVATRQKQKIEDVLQGASGATRELAISYDLKTALASYTTTKKTQDQAALETLLLNAEARSTEMTDALITDFSGSVIASTTKKDVGTSVAQKPYFLAGAKTGNVVAVQETGATSVKIYFSYKVTVDGKDLAMLFTAISATQINGILQDYSGLGDTGQTILAQKDTEGNSISIAPTRFDKEGALRTNLNSLPLFEATNQTYPKLTDHRGHEVLAVTQNLPLANWALIVTLDKSEEFAPINALRNILVIIFVIALVVVSLLALYSARFFTTPIIALTEKTRRIILGDFTQKITVTTSDEVGTLAATFNTMSSRLAESYRALEQKVADRTQALNQKVQELAASKAKDEAILSNIGEGLMVTDNSGHIMLMNHIAEELLELESGGYLGARLEAISQLTEEDNSPFVFQNHIPGRGFTAQTRLTSNLILSKKSGAKGALTLTITPIVSNGEQLGIIAIIRDITKEKEVDRMKTEFISLASHQLRTPLSAIKWFSEMLIAGDAGPLNKEQLEFTQNIAGSTERMTDLVTALLNISRIESGRIIIDPKPTDLNELLSGIVNDLQAKIKEREQHLAVSVHRDLPKINLDPHLIGQVYLNLLTNAIKYTPKGGEITVLVSRSGDQLLSQVSDNGYGIPKKEQPRMFEKFFRATNITKIETDGTGLGMYLIKAIVESSGGKIWFKSEEGKGTTFWFSLPMSGMKAKAGEVTIGE